MCQGVQAQTADSLRLLYTANKVFDFRDAVEHTTAPLFYRGIVEASANDLKAAERDLQAVIAVAPHSDDAYEAHDLLGNMYSRNGMYQDAFREITAALVVRPDGGDAKSILPIASALNRAKPQILVERRSTKLQIERGTIDLPVRIDGKHADYFSDTGAGISVMGDPKPSASDLSKKL